jgi:hypothetical protein
MADWLPCPVCGTKTEVLASAVEQDRGMEWRCYECMTPLVVGASGIERIPLRDAERRVRNTITVASVLGMLIDNGGEGEIRPGSRTLDIAGDHGARRAKCNQVTPWMLRATGLIEPTGERFRYRITEAGRITAQRGYRAETHKVRADGKAMPA